MKSAYLTAALVLAAPAAIAAPAAYVLDPSHSQVVFSYDHLGFSTTTAMFSGFSGDITFDAENPAASTVTVSIPVRSMLTGWQERFEHFMSPDFFDAAEGDMVTFASTGIEVTGDATARITGDLTVNGISKPVVLDAAMTQAGTHPMAQKPWAGFDATATIKRSDFGLGMFAPYVGDEIDVRISIEAMQAE